MSRFRKTWRRFSAHMESKPRLKRIAVWAAAAFLIEVFHPEFFDSHNFVILFATSAAVCIYPDDE